MMRTHLAMLGFVPLLLIGLLAGCGSPQGATSTPALSTPVVPATISVPSSQRLVLSVRAVGVQIYACRVTPGQTGGTQSYGWTLKAPEASLLDARGTQIGKHYEGPTWELNDGSKVVGAAQASVTMADGDSIPWLLLKAVKNEGNGTLTPVRAIQRVQTVGGKAPASGCDAAALDHEMRVPYEAAYYFYRDAA
jgi:hypothetical protein